MMRIIGGGLLIVAGLAALGWGWRENKSNKEEPFSPYTILYSSWEKYKQRYINEDGRVIDFSEDSVTTSEGQSYAMWRAVLVDDRSTFDKTWGWTKNNLKREEDSLFSWRWGKKKDGSYGVLENGGENSASDADQEIAMSLIQASERWGDNKYKEEALIIIKDIYKIETSSVVPGGERYISAGNWASNEEEIYTNPSYFYPYAWRLFATVDRENDWEGLIEPAYEILKASSLSPLDKSKSSGLPPNWLVIERKTGIIKAAEDEKLNTDYSYDAMRVPFRVALDYAWHKDERAKQYLEDSFKILSQDYKTRNKLAGSYGHDGIIIEQTESPAMYASALGYFINTDKEAAKRIYDEKIIGLYSNDKNNFREDLPYYDQNWLWFGAALYNNFLKSI